MNQQIWEEEQSHVSEVSKKLIGHIESLQLLLKKKKGELLEERTSTSNNFSDISDGKAIDFAQILPFLKERELRYVNISEALAKFELLYKSPYFGRIDIMDEDGTPESIYIGLSTFCEEGTGDIIIHDWRAPISSLFYENTIGAVSYKIPNGEELQVRIDKRRQFKIAYDKLLQLFDADLYIGDEVLQELLVDTAKQKMKSIVATIQSDQNAVIRSASHRNMIVLGPPGSGKTSVAMQRMAYLLYEYRKTMSASNIMLISPSDLFNDYISNVLPELGEENVVHSTFYRLFKDISGLGITAETYYENIERHQISNYEDKASYSFKSSNSYAMQLINYIKKLETSGMVFYTLKIAEKVFASSAELKELFYKKFTQFEIDFRLKKIRNLLIERLGIWSGEAIEIRHEELRAIERYIGDDEELRKRSVREVGKRFKVLSAAINNLGFLNVNKIYTNSIVFENDRDEAKNIQQETIGYLKTKHVSYEDLAPIMYIQAVLKGLNKNKAIKHIVIDEIQDYTYLQLKVIQVLFPKAHYTLLGDKNQMVHPTEKDMIADMDLPNFSIVELNKSYRSSNEITNFMSAILQQEEIISLGVSGHKPLIKNVKNYELVYTIASLINQHHETSSSFAILCKDMKSCLNLFEQLKETVPNIQIITQEQKVYMKGILIMPGYMAKGFEFTTVLIADANQETYVPPQDAYLLYTMTSRATRKLIILYTNILAEPIKKVDGELYTFN